MKMVGGRAREQAKGKKQRKDRGTPKGVPLSCQKSKKTARLEVKSALPSDKPVPT